MMEKLAFNFSPFWGPIGNDVDIDTKKSKSNSMQSLLTLIIFFCLGADDDAGANPKINRICKLT